MNSTSNRQQQDWHLRLPHGATLSLASPVVMGILNVTPDSFSDGGKFSTHDLAIAQAERMIADGAMIIDVGGESTRPGASPVTPEEEQSRVIPVIRELAKRTGITISIDTYHSDTAERALDAGASIINDITALRGDTRMTAVAAKSGAPVILMHMLGTPQTMQQSPMYANVVAEVMEFLQDRIAFAVNAGIRPEQIVIDPGIGFGKRLEDNLALLRHLGDFAALGKALMIGVSRKSFIQKIDQTAIAPTDRLGGTLAATIIALQQGARIIRAHDVRETVQAIKIRERIASA